MFWTSIINKTQHFLRIILSYLTYESNLYILSTLFQYLIMLISILFFSSFL